MSCDQCGAYGSHAYYCPYLTTPNLPIGNPQKPTRYVAELADWLKRVEAIAKIKKAEEDNK